MPRRFARLGIAAFAALLAAGCIEAQFNVTKQVVPEGASVGPFTVRIECEPTPPPIVLPPSVDEGEGAPPESEGAEAQAVAAFFGPPPPQTQDIVFNGPDTTLSNFFDEDSTCLITEPESAGAVTVTFSCTGVTPPEQADLVTCTNVPNGLQVVIGSGGIEDEDMIIDILVVNDFTPPPVVVDPAPAVVEAPNFTG